MTISKQSTKSISSSKKNNWLSFLQEGKKNVDPWMFYFFLIFSIITIIFYAIWRFDDPTWLNGFDNIGGPVVLVILLVYGIITAFVEKNISTDRKFVVTNALCGSIDAIVFTSFIYILGGLCLSIILQMSGHNILSTLYELINPYWFFGIMIALIIGYYVSAKLGANIRKFTYDMYTIWAGPIFRILLTLSIWLFFYGSILSFAGSKSDNKNEWAAILFIVFASIIILILSYFTFDSGGKIEIMVERMINYLQRPLSHFCKDLDKREKEVVKMLNKEKLTGKKSLFNSGKDSNFIKQLLNNISDFLKYMIGHPDTIDKKMEAAENKKKIREDQDEKQKTAHIT